MSSTNWKELQQRLKSEREQQPADLYTSAKCTVPEEIGFRIADGLVNGESLHSIVKDLPGITYGMVMYWLVGGQKGGAAGVLSANYARIREAQAARIGQLAVEIILDQGSMNPQRDFRHSRVAIDGARWIGAKLDRTRWGDNLNVQHSGSVTLNEIVTEAREKRQGLLDRARAPIEGTARVINEPEPETVDCVEESNT